MKTNNNLVRRCIYWQKSGEVANHLFFTTSSASFFNILLYVSHSRKLIVSKKNTPLLLTPFKMRFIRNFGPRHVVLCVHGTGGRGTVGVVHLAVSAS